MRYALIRHNVLQNIVLVDPSTDSGAAFLQQLGTEWQQVRALPDKGPESLAGVGWTLESQTDRLQPPTASPAEAAAPVPRRIAVGSFFDRFGAAKWPILADATPLVSALVRDCMARKFIDLDRPDLPTALDLLKQAGHDVDAAQILAAPVQPEEAP